jgi:hypothetical protein
MVGSCQYGIENLGAMEGAEFPDYQCDFSFLRSILLFKVRCRQQWPYECFMQCGCS